MDGQLAIEMIQWDSKIGYISL